MFFNWFLVYKKSRVLFFTLYILPLMGIAISMSLTALPAGLRPKFIPNAGQPPERKFSGFPNPSPNREASCRPWEAGKKRTR